MLWWIISSERKHDENQDYTILLEIKAGGKLFETRVTITDFIEHFMSYTIFYYILNEISHQIKKKC